MEFGQCNIHKQCSVILFLPRLTTNAMNSGITSHCSNEPTNHSYYNYGTAMMINKNIKVT